MSLKSVSHSWQAFDRCSLYWTAEKHSRPSTILVGRPSFRQWPMTQRPHWSCGQERSDGGVYRYIYPTKISLPYKFLCGYWLFFFLFDPGQIRYRVSVRLSSCFFYLLTHHNLYPPNEIPGYALGTGVTQKWQGEKWQLFAYCT